jgi:hypothetical protein
MKWIINLLFPPTTGRTIRISRDHLPGLKPPTSAHYTPEPPKTNLPAAPTLEDHYKNFLASDASKKKPAKRKKGLDH